MEVSEVLPDHVVFGSFALIPVALLLLSWAYAFLKPKYSVEVRHDSEMYFIEPRTGEKVLFPRIEDPATVDLSIIVPSYEEQLRLPLMLDDCLEYLKGRESSEKNFRFEIIIVDDGSKDETSKVGLEFSKSLGTDKVRVLTLRKNRGKGGAVKLGVLNARGAKILFADADGATSFPELDKLELELKRLMERKGVSCVDLEALSLNDAIVCGSRAHLEEESISQRSLFRTLQMYAFHFLVWLFAVRTVSDTQCGFKLFTRSTARKLFANLHVQRWAFDVELLFLSEKLNIPIGEVAVKWTEIEGSKIVPLWSAVQMGRDLVLLWLWYKLRIWQIKPGTV